MVVVALNFSSAHADLKVGATQTVAHRGLSNENSGPITAAYDHQADPVIELQLENAGVRLAHLLDGLTLSPDKTQIVSARRRAWYGGRGRGTTSAAAQAPGVSGRRWRSGGSAAEAGGNRQAGKWVHAGN